MTGPAGEGPRPPGPDGPYGAEGRPPDTGAGEDMWRVRVDEKACMATGICAGTAPGRFRVHDGASHPTSEIIPPAPEVIDAAESCPMEAILVTHRGTGARIAPEE
ncbi:ferredoxin [Streptomyces sp. NPDC018610]|uniref:ferredoxin n=1 Tax=Streptomyces sp. NPDC018610 TaxID=3365049 RepID=UPI003799F887